ncbi:MAG: hypothetical protein JXR03_15865 [Cyclobacteriaceae bacterium]
MSIFNKLASSLGDPTQKPNKALANEILKTNDHDAIIELQQLLKSSDQKVVSDVLKVLNEIGEANASLAKDLFDDVVPFLENKKNMIIWMGIGALSHITIYHPAKTYAHLAKILKIMDDGSVITRDRGFVILVGLYSNARYQKDIKPLIIEQLLKAPDNQFGQYVEKWMLEISDDDRKNLIDVLEERLAELVHPSHQKRAQKNLKKLIKVK